MIAAPQLTVKGNICQTRPASSETAWRCRGSASRRTQRTILEVDADKTCGGSTLAHLRSQRSLGFSASVSSARVSSDWSSARVTIFSTSSP